MAHPINAAFYASREWRQLRRACFDRDRWRCTAPGCIERAIVADHIERRPLSSALTEADCLGNLRSLCLRHDARVKELASGARRGGGELRALGVTADGWPVTPMRHQ